MGWFKLDIRRKYKSNYWYEPLQDFYLDVIGERVQVKSTNVIVIVEEDSELT